VELGRLETERESDCTQQDEHEQIVALVPQARNLMDSIKAEMVCIDWHMWPAAEQSPVHGQRGRVHLFSDHLFEFL
jgi:hypothetical protein